MEELDLKELFSLFWNKKAEIALITLVFIIIGIVYSYFFVTPKYTAAASLLLVQSSAATQTGSTAITSTDLNINSQLVSTYSDLIKRNTILGQVAKNLNLSDEEVEKIRRSISVENVKDTETIEIRVTSEDPNYAAKIANEITNVFSEKIVDIFNLSNVYLLDRAEANAEPSNINHLKDIVVFTFIGLVISAIYVLVFNMLDNTIKTEEDIEKTTGLIVLTAIPNYEAEFRTPKGGKK